MIWEYPSASSGLGGPLTRFTGNFIEGNGLVAGLSACDSLSTDRLLLVLSLGREVRCTGLPLIGVSTGRLGLVTTAAEFDDSSAMGRFNKIGSFREGPLEVEEDDEEAGGVAIWCRLVLPFFEPSLTTYRILRIKNIYFA